jgi:hypothetical protein
VLPLIDEQVPAFDADLGADIDGSVAGTFETQMLMNETAGADTNGSVADMFEMQMLVNHFSQLAEETSPW